MDINEKMLEGEILNELSQRAKQYRISCDITQAELADKAMVSLGTVVRFENGNDISLMRLIRILKVLGLESEFDMLIPDSTKRPSYHLDDSKKKQRVRKSKDSGSEKQWKWGDDK